MSRLPLLDPAALEPGAQAIWNHIAASRSGNAGTMRGPYQVLMNIPGLAERIGAVEDYFRFEAELPAPDRELVILATARDAGARYAWARHEVRGRETGTRPEAIEALRSLGPLDGLTERERLIVEVVRELRRTATLSEATFQRALDVLGQRQLIEVVALSGHYGIVGSVINAFGVQEATPTF